MTQPSPCEPAPNPKQTGGYSTACAVVLAIAVVTALLGLFSFASSALLQDDRQEVLARIEHRKVVEHVVMENGTPLITQGHYITLRRQDGRGDKLRRRIDAKRFATLHEGQIVKIYEGIASPDKFDFAPLTATPWQMALRYFTWAGLAALLAGFGFWRVRRAKPNQP